MESLDKIKSPGSTGSGSPKSQEEDVKVGLLKEI